MNLSATQIDQLERMGYLSVSAIADLSEVDAIKDVLMRLLDKKAGSREGAFFDMLATETNPTARDLIEIRNPMDYAQKLAATSYVFHAKEIARQVLGENARLWFDLVLLKSAVSNAPTPWHQDEAFREPQFEYHEIAFWMPLQDTAIENGCLSFIPESHKRRVLAHRSPGNDPSAHALECCGEFDPTGAVACPLQAGDCTIHYGRTLHHAGPNLSDRPRYAYILGFHLPPRRGEEERSFPWLAEKHTRDQALRRRWLLRGGIFVTAFRKWRRGGDFSLDSIRYAARRTARFIRK